MPKLKGISFETAIIERYRRRESNVEELTYALWGGKVSSGQNMKAYVHIEDWRNSPLQGVRYPYIYVDGIYLRRNWGREFENVAILVAIAVNEDGYREVLGAAEGMKEDKASWVNFFQWLRGRGLDGVKLVVGDKCLGMLEAVGEVIFRGKIPTVCSPLFPECVCCYTALQGKAGGQDSQSDPRPRKQKSCSGESRSRGRRTTLHEAGRSSQEGGGWHRSNASLL